MIGPAGTARDSQHHIADLTSQGRPAKDRIPAKDTFQRYLVPWFSILETDVSGEDEYEKLPFSVYPNVMGAKLPCYGDHALFFGGDTFHQLSSRDHRKHIYRGG